MQWATRVATGGWHHVAIALARPCFLHYEDGVETGSGRVPLRFAVAPRSRFVETF